MRRRLAIAFLSPHLVTMADAKSNLVIVGAGFSANAGLPLASGFTPALLRTKGLNHDGPSQAQVEFLQAFVRDVFAEGAPVGPDDWPELEDILTFVDLAANSGHHLGPLYSAAELRTVRRTIITRMIRMLDQRRRRGQVRKRSGWRQLRRFFRSFDAIVLRHSRLRFRVPNCMRLRSDGTNEEAGVAPDMPVLPTEGESDRARGERALRVIVGDMADASVQGRR